jgi:hypothetical protein
MDPHQEISRRSDRYIWAGGAFVGWLMLGLLIKLGSPREVVFTSILSGPPVIALTYFALGGRIPRALRAKGLHAWGAIVVVAWISILAAASFDFLSRK